jgi:hypothetical protein
MIEPKPDEIVGFTVKTGVFLTNQADYLGKIRVLHDMRGRELAQAAESRNLQPARLTVLPEHRGA